MSDSRTASARLAVLFVGVPCVLTVLHVPAFAQPDTRTSATAAREYVPAESQQAGGATLPLNFIVPAEFRSAVESMLQRSPTFRRQCQRIANALHMTVTIQRPICPLSPGTRARTQIFKAPSGGVYARIEVPAQGDAVELIAHEIEHVIEQLDEVDLASVAKRANAGVRAAYRDNVTTYETRRAARVGMMVAGEVRFARR